MSLEENLTSAAQTLLETPRGSRGLLGKYLAYLSAGHAPLADAFALIDWALQQRPPMVVSRATARNTLREAHDRVMAQPAAPKPAGTSRSHLIARQDGVTLTIFPEDGASKTVELSWAEWKELSTLVLRQMDYVKYISGAQS